MALLFITGGSLERQPPSSAAGVAGRRREGHRHGHRGAAPGAEPAGRVQGRPGEEAAHRRRLHRLHLEQVPAHRRREMAGAAADDQERRAGDGRHHRSSRRRRKAAAQKVARFVVSGASKRGWTTWTTAAVDKRVIAIAPAVIDMLNVEPSFVHHYRAYGAWSDAVKDYTEQGIMDWMGTPQFRALMKIEEPYEYRDRLTMPEADAERVGRSVLPARLVAVLLRRSQGREAPALRAEHVARPRQERCARDAARVLCVDRRRHRRARRSSGRFEKDGSIKVVTQASCRRDVQLWQAVNPTARNFRLDAIGPAYKNTPLKPSGPNTWVGKVPPPPAAGPRSSSRSRSRARASIRSS